jgi:hypothetical protein
MSNNNNNNNNNNPFANMHHLNALVQQSVQHFYQKNYITDQQKKKLVQHKVILPNEIEKGQNYNKRHKILNTIRSHPVDNMDGYNVMKSTSNPWTTYSFKSDPTNGHTNDPRRVGNR